MKVEQVDHIHIAVKDMDKSVKLFENLFDMKFCREFVSDEMKLKSRIGAIGFVGIELIQATSPDSEIAKFIERRGEGIQAISLKVPDIKKATAEMKAKGVRLIANVELPMIKEAEFHPKDTCGVQIEFIEYDVLPGGVFALFEMTAT